MSRHGCEIVISGSTTGSGQLVKEGMMLKSMLVAFDGSDQSLRAFALGHEFATRFNANVLLVRVMPTLEFEAMPESKADSLAEEVLGLCRQIQREGLSCKNADLT